MTTATKQGKSWGYFVWMFLCAAVFAISFFKVPPAIPTLMAYFDMGVAEVGWTMSWCSVAGTLIAFFTGALQKKFGPKNLLVLAVICGALDSLIGALAPNQEIFFLSRFICGLGNGFLATGGPTLISLYFKDPARRGMPNAIWACWTSVGSLIILNTFAFLINTTGSWQGVWWICFAINVVFIFVAIFAIKLGKDDLESVTKGGNVKPWTGLTMVNTWLLVIIFACFAFIFSVWNALAPTYMQTEAGGLIDMATSNSILSITTITGILGSLVIGAVLAKVKNQPMVLLVATILCAAVGCLEFVFSGVGMMIFMAAAAGFFIQLVPACLFQNAQWGARTPAGVAMILAALPIGSNFGGIPAAPSVGAIVEATGSWASSSIILAIVGAVSILCAIIFVVRCSKYATGKVKVDSEEENAS